VRAARARKESRGLHYSRDYPDLLPQALDTVLVPDAALSGTQSARMASV